MANPTIRVLNYADPGAGKCESFGTPVLMYDGSIKQIQEIRTDDLLMGPDSKPRRVINTTQGQGHMNRIVPIKGDPFTCNDFHILSLWCKKSGRPGWYSETRVKDFLQYSHHLQTRAKLWRSGVQLRPIEFDPALPPYLLGIWLGDGAKQSPTLFIHKPDEEIGDYLASYAQRFSLELVPHQDGSHRSWSIAGQRGTHTKTPPMQAIKSLGLSYLAPEELFVPTTYKCNTEHVRLEILAGLLDSDGHLDNGKNFDFVSKSRQLAEDVTYLSRSLGFAAYCHQCTKICVNNGVAGTYWRVSISGDLSRIPTRIKRKQASKRQQIKDVLHTGIKGVEDAGIGDYYGFQLDGDGLYLHGDFTVTHNSTFAATFPKPMLVFFVDTAGKEQPYADRVLDFGGSVSDPDTDLAEASGIKDLRGQQMWDKNGKLIIQIEYYLDDNPENPIGSLRFKTRLAGLHHHYAAWRTFCVDHISGLSRTFTYYEQFSRNPGAKDPRQWVGECTSMIERYIATRLANLRSHNVVVLAHIDEQKDELNGHMIRTIKAPGRMRKGLADAYSEVYRGYIQNSPDLKDPRKREYLLQTQGDSVWMAASRLRPVPPDPCPANYKALWSNGAAV